MNLIFKYNFNRHYYKFDIYQSYSTVSMFKYIKYADMLKQIIQRKKQVKDVIYSNKKQGGRNQNQNDLNISASYSLLSLATNNFGKFMDFIQKIQLRSKSTIKNPYLLIIMLGQYINLGKIKGGGKIKRIILQNIDLLPQIKKQTRINKKTVQIRLIQSVNEDKHDNEDTFQKWKVVFENQKKFVKNQLIKNVYDLSSDQYKQILHQYPQLLKSHFSVIQSFSSSIPPFLLLHGVQNSSLKDFKVIDACSAPGNKTIQLGEYIQKGSFKRQVLAFQKDAKRFQILNRTIQRFNLQRNIKSFNQNFLQTNPYDERFKNVKFLLLDPSCSGSGMLSNFLRDATYDQVKVNNMSFQDFCDHQYAVLVQEQKQRVQKLHDFQLQLLNHAAKFKPKRISYSTCSIYKRQNQEVVHEFLGLNPEYSLKQSKIITRNIGKYSMCEGFNQYRHCVRIDPRRRQTDGFFVALFYKKSQQ